MAKISTTIPIISDYPKIGDTHAVFRQKADIAWRDLAAAIPKINTWSGEANSLRNDVNVWRNDTERFREDALNARNTAFGYKEEAANAANRAEAVVIPTEATYSLNDLEIALNGLLTQIVAQQAQISILKGA